MAIDATWQRDCRIADVPDTGAKLTAHGSVDGIDMREFFLVLTPSGNTHRRCERIRLSDEVGVRLRKDVPAAAANVERRRPWLWLARRSAARHGLPLSSLRRPLHL